MSNPHDAEARDRLERMMDQYGADLLRLCAIYLRDPELARDAVQDTFLKAYRAMDRFRGEVSEKTYLTSIAMSVCRDMLKSAWFRHRSPIALDRLPEEAADFQMPDDTVLCEVMRLPVRYREIVLLRYYRGMKLGEIAEALGISLGKVRSRLDSANGIRLMWPSCRMSP